MKYIITLSALLLILFSLNLSAQTGKPIRGIVTDNASEKALEFATVSIINLNPPIGAMTDSLGEFVIEKLPIGRYDIQATMVGYDPMIIKEVMVSSAKETFLTFSLNENVTQLKEIVVKPKINKQEPINNIALASARMLSVEESSRYAGGFDDPARLVTSFAGVSGNVSSNKIAVRGNSPQSLQWKLEGVEIPNPTHFPDVTGVGGGILTALSSQVLGNSDFLTGAFPSEYTNALSGVFDMQMRNGNRWKRESTVQVGAMGIDLSSEGPFKKAGQSSYLFNYRYSTMSMLGNLVPDLVKEAAGMKYQDLSFKLNFPSRKYGTLSVWGIGIIDNYKEKYEKDISKWEVKWDRTTDIQNRTMASGGIGHKIFLNDDTYIKSSLATTYSESHIKIDLYNFDKVPFRIWDLKVSNMNYIMNSYINKKFSSKHTNRTGITATALFFDMNYNHSPDNSYNSDPEPMVNFAKDKGSTMLYSAFTNSTFRFSEIITANIGINSQHFRLNNEWTLEPRIGIKIQVSPKHTFGLAYGNHSRHERLEYYFVSSPETGYKQTNKDLKLSRANHFILSYDWSINENLHLKVEPYYQYLYNVPVVQDSSFSIINQNALHMMLPLVSKGKGRNYGIDVTLERYLADGYYYMFTASLFSSRYKGGDGIWRDTRLNRKFLFNMLGGKEWIVGKKKQNIFGLNLRATYQGGERHSPVNEEASLLEGYAIYDESRAFQSHYKPALITSFTINYKMNKDKVAHNFSVSILNLNGYAEPIEHVYNFKKHKIEEFTYRVVMPNVSYKIHF